jgi:hypothetical protein
MFENLVWQKDRMLLNGLVFRLQHFLSDDWELKDDCFIFFKDQPLVDQYEAFFATQQNFRPQNVFELGLWDGGSLAFWFESLKPKKQIGIDVQGRTDSDYFRRYIADRGLGDRLKSYWGVDQSDGQKLREIVRREFDGPLDLVFDDASHLYEFTKNSFECLFPLVRPGGFYVIEDWAWDLWDEFDVPGHPMEEYEGPARFVGELVEAAGSSKGVIKSLTIYRGFTAVERGEAFLAADSSFRLQDHIYQRARPARM